MDIVCKTCGEKETKCSVLKNRFLDMYCGCYVERKKDFDRAKNMLNKGQFIQIMAPQGYGKHSFMIRLENYARNERQYKTVFIDFWEEDILPSEPALFYQLVCKIVSRNLMLHSKIDKNIRDIWRRYKYCSEEGKCDKYIEMFILRMYRQKIVFFVRGLAKLNVGLQHNFYNTLKRWNSSIENSNTADWKNLSIVIAYSPNINSKISGKNEKKREPYSFGHELLPIQIDEFKDEEVYNLAERFKLKGTKRKFKEVANLLNYQPYLTNFAFCKIKNNEITLGTFKKKAHTIPGIYADHFKYLNENITNNLEQKIRSYLNKRPDDSFDSDDLYTLGIYTRNKEKTNTGIYKMNTLYEKYYKKRYSWNKGRKRKILIAVFFCLCMPLFFYLSSPVIPISLMDTILKPIFVAFSLIGIIATIIPLFNSKSQ